MAKPELSPFKLTPSEQKRYDLYKQGLDVKQILTALSLAANSRSSVYLAIEKGKQIDRMDTTTQYVPPKVTKTGGKQTVTLSKSRGNRPRTELWRLDGKG